MERFDPNSRYFTDYFCIGAAGSRGFDSYSDPAVMSQCVNLIEGFIFEAPRVAIVSGGAWGWDRFITRVAVRMRLPFVLIIPYPGYGDRYWGPEGSTDGKDHTDSWKAMLCRAAECFYVREDHYGSARYHFKPGWSHYDRVDTMVSILDHCLVWGGDSGGRHCLNALNDAGVGYSTISTGRYQ